MYGICLFLIFFSGLSNSRIWIDETVIFGWFDIIFLYVLFGFSAGRNGVPFLFMLLVWCILRFCDWVGFRGFLANWWLRVCRVFSSGIGRVCEHNMLFSLE